MLQTAILNPALLDLLARIRHTNMLVIADWAFPYWPEIETVDLSLTRGIPTVLDVLDLLPGHRADPHRRRDAVRQYHPGVGVSGRSGLTCRLN